jgi:hypothetical protein
MPEHTQVEGREITEGGSMMINEGPINDATNIPGFKQTTNFRPNYAAEQAEKKKKKSLIGRFFSNMARMGMTYDEDVIDNMRAIPADKNLLPKEYQLTNQDLFTQLSTSWKVKANADKNFFEKDYPQKRDALRKLSLQPELEDILDTMANEAIVYDTNLTYFAEPFIDPQELQDLKPDMREKITESMSRSFRRFYKMLNWKYKAWDDFKRWLVEGILAWEIVYDSLEKPTRIIGIVPLDPATLTKKFDHNKWYWLQYKGIQGKERKLLDSQVIYVPYQETESVGRVSYLERLIRPFNIYRIIEQAQLIWYVTNASYKMKFTIPIKGMNRTMGMQTVSSAMNRYKEDIKFIADTGELTINGQVNMPFNKEYWFPESDSGTPNIETLGGEGPEINDPDFLKYFKNCLYKISKIPITRFDQENGETWFGSDATSVARTEINFGRYVTRLRNQFAMIMVKPLQLQLALDFKELQDNRAFLDTITLQYKSYNLFEEMMELELMSKRIQGIQEMKDGLVDMSPSGAEIKFFSSKFLVKKYLKLSDADLELNDKLKDEDMKEFKEYDAQNSEGQDDDYDKMMGDMSSANPEPATLSEEAPMTSIDADDDKPTKPLKEKPKKKSSKKKSKKDEEE